MPKRLTLFFLLALTVVAIILAYFVLEPFLRPVLTALVLAIAFFPLHAWVQRRVRKPERAALATITIIILAVLIPLTVIGVIASRELRVLIDSLRQFSGQSGGLTMYLQDLSDRALALAGQYVSVSDFDVQEEIVNLLQNTRGALLRSAGSFLGNLAAMIVNSVIVLFVMFFLFREGPRVRVRLEGALPLRAHQFERLFQGVRDTIQASMYGILSVAVAQACLQGLGFWLLGVPGPVLWGSLTAFASLIPLVGASVIWAPAAVWLLVSGSWVKALLMVLWGAGLVGTIDNFLRPYVMSGKVELHPVLLLFSLLGGVQAFGMIGVFAGPVILAVTQTLIHLLFEEMRAADSEPQGSS